MFYIFFWVVLIAILAALIITFRKGILRLSGLAVFLIKVIYALIGGYLGWFLMGQVGIRILYATICKYAPFGEFCDVLSTWLLTIWLLTIASLFIGTLGVFILLSFLFRKPGEPGESNFFSSYLSASLSAFLAGIVFLWLATPFVRNDPKIGSLPGFLGDYWPLPSLIFGDLWPPHLLILSLILTIIFFVILLKFFKKVSAKK